MRANIKGFLGPYERNFKKSLLVKLISSLVYIQTYFLIILISSFE